MDEDEKFHGFPEDDEVRATIGDKLERLNLFFNKLERKEETTLETTACSSYGVLSDDKSRPKRPPNRFLRRSGNLPVAVPVNVKAETTKKCEPVFRSPDARLVQPSLVIDKPQSIPEVATKIIPDINGSSTVLLSKEKLPPMPSLVKYAPMKLPKPPALKRISVPQNELETMMPLLSPNEPTEHHTNSKLTSVTPRRTNKFLKVKSCNSGDEINKTNGDLFADNNKCDPVNTFVPSPPVLSHSSNSITQEKQLPAKKVPSVEMTKKPVIVNKNVNTQPPPEASPVAVETMDNSFSVCDEKSKPEGRKPIKAELVTPADQVVERHTRVTKSKSSKPPSPAKRAASTSELNFLNSQTSRSKRTIVPNKRFFSTDDSPSTTPAKPEEKNASVRRVVGKPLHTEGLKKTVVPRGTTKKLQEESLVQDRVFKGKRRRNFSAETETNGTADTEFASALNEDKVSKKRSESVDTAKQNLKTTIESNHASVADISSSVPSVDAPGSHELTARPRRTIIPNRKFFDEDEPPKEMVSKKADINEPKRKRRKSEKIAQPNEEVEVTNNLSEKVAKPLKDERLASSVVNVDSRKVTDSCESISTTSSVSGSSNIAKKVNGAKAETKSKAQEDDELPLDETEAAFYRGNIALLGACVLKTDVDLLTSNEESCENGVICCGICRRIKKYRALAEKRKRGSFLCSDCGDVVNKIFTNAMKAKSFSSIVGPPICEGSCPILFSPLDQFCEACFAKTCLRNLPMKDDIYFKIWRAIPPLSRGCVSTTPIANPNTPNVGKIVQVNETGVIGKTTTSLKMLGSRKTNHNGIDVAQEDSNSCDNKNGDVDLISARITTFSHRIDSASSSSNCENTVPKNSIDESHNLENSNSVKSTGVSKEEMLLGRQTGQERVKALIDPILKPDLTDIEIFGFPVVVCGTAYPRKPLCFLCGSSGIEQLIFCSQCCEPFHPYCAGDDVLLDTYISRYTCQESQTVEHNSCEDDVMEEISEINPSVSTIQNTIVKKETDDDDSKLVLKWTCRRCMACKCCGVSIGQEELIRCSRCRNPYHLQTCIDKRCLSKIKDLDKLKKLWTCETCLKCKSCGKQIEFSKKIQPIKVGGEDDEQESGSSSQGNCLMLCIDCFKQRKKGSFCPFCDVSYDDNDWDSKMMECCKCNRWIHSTCEKLNDEEYHILGTLPEYIEYICRLCDPVDTPLWYSSIQSQISKDCSSVIRLFEKKTFGSFRKKRSSIDVINEKPHYVCNLFGDNVSNDDDDDDADSNLSTLVPDDDEYTKDIVEEEPEVVVLSDEEMESTPRLRPTIRKKVSGNEILSCKVFVRDFVKFPQTLEEHWYALKASGVEILNKFQAVEEVRIPTTPIHNTPVKCFTPTKHVSSVCDSIRSSINSIKSLRVFQNLVMRTIKNSGEGDAGVEIMIGFAKEAMQEVFPWFKQEWNYTIDDFEQEVASSVNPAEDVVSSINGDRDCTTSDPFKEVFWNPADFFDNRMCSLCGEVGDFPPDSCGRLLWIGLNEWIHCNCALWSSEVFELENGALQQIGNALHRGKSLRCPVCLKKGATVSCCKSGCKQSYHFLCAREDNCSLLQAQKMFCPRHELSERQKDEIQHDMKIGRKVFVDIEWIQKREQKACVDDITIFVGSLRVDCFGSILPISVANKTWEDSNTTFIVPVNFKAQRVFWSSEDPWEKQCYTFETRIGSNGFEENVNDVGINLVIDHVRSEESVHRGLQNISKFHQWVDNAPKYFDEHLMDWLPRCSKEFRREYDGFDLFSSKRKTSCSPVSVSSFSSFNKLTPTSRFQDPNFRKITEGIERDVIETTSTEGYSSSADDKMVSKVSPGKNKKRRRSSCRTRSKRQLNQLNTTTLSPRRRSMRNRRLLGEASEDIICDVGTDKLADSDNDSGVMEGSSATGSYDGERVRCRVNLLTQFNESADLEMLNSDMVSESSCLDHLYQSPPDDQEEDLQFYSCTSKSENEVYYAAVKFEARSNKSVSCFDSCDARSTWMSVFESVSKSRLSPLTQPTLGTAVAGDELTLANSFRMLGITHRSVQYLIEQLPGMIKVGDRHTFKYSHRPYVDPDNEDLPAIVNAAGCARSEGFKGRKPFDMFGFLASHHREVSMSCNLPEETLRNQGLPLAMRFRDLRGNWTKARERFVVLHSHIHGRGLYARCDMEKGDIIIEYAGELIRPSLTDLREKYYESRGIGCYMFRINDTEVIDATLKGNAARFINHSCEPNCEAKTVRILGKNHILIFALRKIFKGEELTYDYKFEREEKKIPCSCGASRCRKYMN